MVKHSVVICPWPTHWYGRRGNISSGFSGIHGVSASELLQVLEWMFPRYWMDSDVINMFKYVITHSVYIYVCVCFDRCVCILYLCHFKSSIHIHCISRRERVKTILILGYLKKYCNIQTRKTSMNLEKSFTRKYGRMFVYY